MNFALNNQDSHPPVAATNSRARRDQTLAAVAGTDDSPHQCGNCGKATADGGWFCRLHGGAKRIELCNPWCALRYLEHLRNNEK
jgi:hypothetical protein